MLKNDYAFALALYTHTGAPLARVPVTVDFEPAAQWTWFTALRQGQPVTDGSRMTLSPIWHPTLGSPYLGAFSVRVETMNGSGGNVSCEFPGRYFTGPAREASAELVERGQLAAGDQFQFVAMAFPFARDRSAVPRGQLHVREVRPSAVLQEQSMAGRTAYAMGHDAMPDDIPVFVPHDVLRQLAALAKEAPRVETGGALIGHIHRDPATSEVFVAVTAQIPARHTEATSTRLTFTSETWAAMRSALALRRREERLVGWWHSHGTRWWCADAKCPRTVHDACNAASDCFSEDDCAVHRTIFPAAFSVALVVNDVSAGQTHFSMFGWRAAGLIERRGFYVQEESTDVS